MDPILKLIHSQGLRPVYHKITEEEVEGWLGVMYERMLLPAEKGFHITVEKILTTYLTIKASILKIYYRTYTFKIPSLNSQRWETTPRLGLT